MQFIIVSLMKSLKSIYDNSNFYKEARIVSFIDRLLDCILGKVKNAMTILNPAPAVELLPELIELSDWIIPNQIEFYSLSNEIPGGDLIEKVKNFYPDKNLLVSLGSDGAILRTNNGKIINASEPKTEVIDTTGAGDGFVGAFAAALNAEKELQIALEFAIKFASNSVGKKGAQSSYPTNLKIN